MDYKKVIYPQTLNLLRELLKESEFSQFRLCGGTAIALQALHRLSYDLDFFTPVEIDRDQLLSLLVNKYKFEPSTNTKYFISGTIIHENRKIKLDFVKYYPWISDEILLENLRLSPLNELAAMKLQAITNRGKRRDFYDLYVLMKKFSLAELKQFYETKFPDGNFALVLKSIDFTFDADNDAEDLVLFLEVSWEEVKKYIKNNLQQYLKNII